MTIGLLQMELMLPNTKSLKDKRSVLKNITSQVRKKFNVAFAELSQNDLVGKAHVGITTLSNKSEFCHKVLTKVEEYISTEFDVVLINRNMEMF